MRDSTPSLYAYIITSLLVIIFYVLKLEDFITIFKPVIVPAIYFYYIQTTIRPIDILFSLAIWIFFIADMAEIVDSERGIYLMMFCGLISYFIMFRYGLKDGVKLSLSFKTLLITILLFGGLALAASYIITYLGPLDIVRLSFFIIYAVVIISIVCYALLRFFSKNDQLSRLFLAMASVMFLSDLLYAYTRYVEFYTLVGVLSFVGQFISYYWMVEYFNKRKMI